MKKVFIISSNFYDASKHQFTIGGIQTYIKDLCLAIIRDGNSATLVQFGDYIHETNITSGGCPIILYPRKRQLFHFGDQYSFDCFYHEHNESDSVFLIDTDQRDIKSKEGNVVQIQHGITFDIPGNMIPGFWGTNLFLQRINKQVRCRRNVARLFHVRNTVCVDYNYFNWFRTQDTIPSDRRIVIIPNYSGSFISMNELESKLKNRNGTIRIVFARRFVEYRGTLLMIKAAQRILTNHSNIEITFAGDGPLKNEIESAFKGEPRVKITNYDSSESVNFHYGYDIAVVPTVFSEGTSLSLCEAMAAGCLPIASCVGGMSNIVLNDYNGLLIQPLQDELDNALLKAITMTAEQKSLIVRRAYNTALMSFSKKRWERQWLDLIHSL